jgi:DNA mismatch repair protein MutL
VNGRFMKHPFFHKAVVHAYDRILPPDTIPSYFLFFEVDPATIDINIHPTKTEIKFEDELAIWHVISACIREAIGKYNLMPTIDFDQRGSIDIPIPPQRGSNFAPPEIEINPHYNPFQKEYGDRRPEFGRNDDVSQWEKLYQGMERERQGDGEPGRQADWETRKQGDREIGEQGDSFPEEDERLQGTFSMGDDQSFPTGSFLQLKNRYLLTPVKSGLMVIDQREAHSKILFENFMQNFNSHISASQRQLFPPVLELNAADAEILGALRDELHQLGFEIRPEADHHFYIDGTPGVLCHLDAKDLVERVIASFQDRPVDLMEEIKVQLAIVLAQSSAGAYGIPLKQEEMNALFNQLFACQSPGYSPSGRRIISIIPLTDIEKLLKN